MGLDVIEEKNLNDIITYALDYPKMVLAQARSLLPVGAVLADFAHGLYIGYITGVFFDGFLKRNNRFLDDNEMSDFNAILFKHGSEIGFKIKAHLHIQ